MGFGDILSNPDAGGVRGWTMECLVVKVAFFFVCFDVVVGKLHLYALVKCHAGVLLSSFCAKDLSCCKMLAN